MSANAREDPMYPKKGLVKLHAMRSSQEHRRRNRLDTLGRSQARTGAMDESNACQYQVGDECDVWRSPDAKDLVGWRGPARITNLLDRKDNKCHVEWQGQMVSVPLDQIRPHVPFLPLYAKGERGG